MCFYKCEEIADPREDYNPYMGNGDGDSVNSADPLFNYSQPSTMGNDSNHAYDVSISKNISSSTLQSILNYSLNYTSTYNLYNYNCTDFVIEIGNFLGMGLPDCYSNFGQSGGSNPGKLGQYIRNNFNSNAVYTVNKNGGASPPILKAVK